MYSSEAALNVLHKWSQSDKVIRISLVSAHAHWRVEAVGVLGTVTEAGFGFTITDKSLIGVDLADASDFRTLDEEAMTGEDTGKSSVELRLGDGVRCILREEPRSATPIH